LDSSGFEPAKHITTFTDSMSFHELQIARALSHFAKTVNPLLHFVSLLPRCGIISIPGINAG
jgi:hypothetical protein